MKSSIKMLLKTANNMKRYRRFKIVFLHYSRSFERKKIEIQKQLPYTPNRELFETIVPYIYKGQLPPIIWGGSCFYYELLRKAGDPFYTHLDEYGCFQSYCCYGDEESAAKLLILFRLLTKYIKIFCSTVFFEFIFLI